MPEEPFFKETETLKNLKVLEEIEKNSKVSQRDLSKELGVALGIVNSLIHTLVRKGMIKIRGKNNRTLTYHLTHRGVLHKSWLAMQWTKNTVSFYLRARQDVVGKLQGLASKGVKTVVIYGTNELAEIALIVAGEAGLKVLGLIDGQGTGRKEMLSYPVGKAEEILKEKPDAIVTCIEVPKEERAKVGELTRNKTKIYRLL